MPLYEYRCDACGNVFEVKQKFSDSPLTIHEGCGGAVQRLLSAPALQFKGSGWYITDYARNSGSGKKEAGDKKESGDKNGASTTDSKPAAKSDTSSTSSSTPSSS
jgi:putative FmdB family regulatory protein